MRRQRKINLFYCKCEIPIAYHKPGQPTACYRCSGLLCPEKEDQAMNPRNKFTPSLPIDQVNESVVVSFLDQIDKDQAIKGASNFLFQHTTGFRLFRDYKKQKGDIWAKIEKLIDAIIGRLKKE